jgi:endoglucanase
MSKNIKNILKNYIKDLTSSISVSGLEQEVSRYLMPRLENVCDSVELTTTGNIIARKKGKADGPTVMLNAHLDEIGFAIKAITDEGFIKFEKVGDFSNRILPARRVLIQGKNGIIPGVIGMKAAHLITADSGSQIQSPAQSYIDIGARSYDEAVQMGAFLGARMVMDSELIEMANPDIISGRCLDDRVGCAILLTIMENLNKNDFAGELIATFTTLEEVTVAGAFPLYDRLRPDYALALDTVPCGDVPDIDTKSELPIYMGKGPVMILTQGDPLVLRFTAIPPQLRALIETTSEEENIPIQQLVLSEKAYITEESLSFMAGGGIPATTIAIPRRYSHTPVEVMDINDAVAGYKLYTAIIKRNGKWKNSFI